MIEKICKQFGFEIKITFRSFRKTTNFETDFTIALFKNCCLKKTLLNTLEGFQQLKTDEFLKKKTKEEVDQEQLSLLFLLLLMLALKESSTEISANLISSGILHSTTTTTATMKSLQAHITRKTRNIFKSLLFRNRDEEETQRKKNNEEDFLFGETHMDGRKRVSCWKHSAACTGMEREREIQT